jgi:hypothetical protein
MYTNRFDRPRCSVCGRFCSYADDSSIAYGCTNYDSPEPRDPDFYCKKCANEKYSSMVRELKQGKKVYIYWQKPAWFTKALKATGKTTVRIDGYEKIINV